MPHSKNEAARRLAGARLVGGAAVAILAQFAVDMPDGYFGPSDTSTPFGLLFTAAAVVAATIGAIGLARGHRYGAVGAALLLALDIGAFVPPLGSDPVIAGLTVAWHLMIVGALLSHVDGKAPPHWSPREHDPTGWLAASGPAARHLLAVSLMVSVAVLGFEIGDRTPALITGLVTSLLALGTAAPFLLGRLRARDAFAWAALALVALAVAALPRPTLSLALLAVANLTILLVVAARLQIFSDALDLFYSQPALLVVSSFGALIGVGTLLLCFPAASATRSPIGFVDALFTATSAACVTGLIVLDTPVDFSLFGQSVILALIQIGGLNIMVLSTFAALLLGRGLGLRGERALGELLDIRTPQTAYRLIRFIVLATAGIELGGAVLLSGAYLGRGYSVAAALWYGLFHAVSAFCNAGFSLHSDSLVGFQRDPLVLLLMAGLITAGGLGFVVLAFVWRRLSHSRNRSLQVQARIVLWVSGVLIVAGTLLYAVAEWDRSLAGLPPLDRLVNALFQSVTLRTAGFNSVGLDTLAPLTLLIMLAFMFVGASPGSTGGGIKTTTAFVLLAAIPALFRHQPRVVVAGRTLTLETVFRSAAIATTTLLVLFLTASLLLASQNISFESLLFETFSAVGTVGLSLGATGMLDSFGKLVIVIAMLAGRVGPLTLVLLLGRRFDSRVSRPEARIMVG